MKKIAIVYWTGTGNTDVLTSDGQVLTVTVPLEMSSFTSQLGTYAILQKDDVKFTFTNVGKNKAKVKRP